MLIFCPECNGQLSEHANACPHCGIPSYKIKDALDKQINAVKEEQKRLERKESIDQAIARLDLDGFNCAVCEEHVKTELTQCPVCEFSVAKSREVRVKIIQAPPVDYTNYVSYHWPPNPCPKCSHKRYGWNECMNCEPAPEGYEHKWYKWKWEAPKRKKQEEEFRRKEYEKEQERIREIKSNRIIFSIGCAGFILIWILLSNFI